jgi:molybdopterin-guanine dinucleotide biosynthesis protein A/HD superfamily phosphohydrolase YqeK
MGHKLRHLPVRFVLNKNYEQGIFSSIQTGVENLPGNAEAFFLLPVDIPLVRVQTIRELMLAYRQKKDDILYPVFMGRRGHPPLIVRRLAWAIGAWGGDNGPHSLLERYEDRAADVPVADEFIHLDMDTRSNLLRLRKHYQRYEIPTDQECLALFEQWNVPEPVIAHSRTVTRVADTLAETLNNAGCHLNTELLHAAALMHDCAKTSTDHARTGAQLLEDAGFRKTAAIVARHMDVGFDADDMLNETHILYLADKLVLDTTVVSLNERLHIMLPRHRGASRQIVIHRLAKAHEIQKRFENMAARPLASFLAEFGRTLSE